MTELHGIDISHWQSGLNVAKTGKDFVIAKATQGVSMVDAECDNFIQAAKKAGMKYGVYAFYDYDDGSPEAQADFFVKHVQGYVGEGILVLDWENGNTKDVATAKKFLDRVYAKTGVKPLIYFNKSVLGSADWSSVAKADYGLWYARYVDDLTDSVSPWKSAALWQSTSSGHVSGYSGNVDLDTFFGDKAAWDAYAGKKSSGGDTPAPAPKPKPEPKDEIDVDGWWGTDTTRLGQEVYGTHVDGKVSGQNVAYKAKNPGLAQGWQWESGSKITGSQLILAIQKEFHVPAADANGIWGPATAKRLQEHYGITEDGVVSGPSELVKALQRTWNAGKKH